MRASTQQKHCYLRDDIRERSHYCISKYIEEKYAEKEIITMKQAIILDSLREKRNDIQYSLEIPELEGRGI